MGDRAMSGVNDLTRFFIDEAPRLRRFLRRFGRGVSADDIVQDTFEQLCATRSENIASPRAYLFRTARNLALNERKRARLIQVDLVGDAAELTVPDGFGDPEQQVLAGDLLVRLYEALALLPEHKRQALVLFKLEGYSYKEIGKRLGVSPRTVERYVADALAHCQKKLRALRKA